MTDAERIEEIRARLLRAVPPGSRVFLFGARARGCTDLVELYPDFRILVIEPTVPRQIDEAIRLRRALDDLDAPIELWVLDEEQARLRAASRWTLLSYALREGELLART